MSDLITVQGVVLSAMPIGEYDKRIVLLTRERGKISAFAKGARRMNSPFMAAANPFVFGTFTLYEGRSSYNLNQVSVRRSFAELAQKQPGIYYGYYFLELADYFGREGTDGKDLMNLLYVTILALDNPSLKDRLVRCIYELRIMTEEGMMPAIYACTACGREPEGEAAWYFSQQNHGLLCPACARQTAVKHTPVGLPAIRTMQYIAAAPMNRLYTFTVTDEILSELEAVIHPYVKLGTDRKFKSLGILEGMESLLVDLTGKRG